MCLCIYYLESSVHGLKTFLLMCLCLYILKLYKDCFCKLIAQLKGGKKTNVLHLVVVQLKVVILKVISADL